MDFHHQAIIAQDVYKHYARGVDGRASTASTCGPPAALAAQNEAGKPAAAIFLLLSANKFRKLGN